MQNYFENPTLRDFSLDLDKDLVTHFFFALIQTDFLISFTRDTLKRGFFLLKGISLCTLSRLSPQINLIFPLLFFFI